MCRIIEHGIYWKGDHNEIFIEQLGGTYHWEGDYLILDLALPDEDEQPIGIWGQRHGNWPKQKRHALYDKLLYMFKLRSHLVEANERAERMLAGLIAEMTNRWA